MSYTLGDWLEKWLEVYKRKLNPQTVKDYRSCIRLYLQDISRKKIKKVLAVDIQACINVIEARRRRAITYCVLNNAFKYALGNRLVKVNPMLAVDIEKGRPKERRAVTEQEEEKLLQVCQSDNFRALIVFYIETGVRRAEALTIRNEDVDLKNRCIYIRGTKSENAERYVPISPRLEMLLKGFYPMSRELLFTFSADYVSRKFRELVRRAGIKGICLHCLRHTFATRCRELGIDDLVRKEWLGHADLQTTMRYTHETKLMKQRGLIALHAHQLAS